MSFDYSQPHRIVNGAPVLLTSDEWADIKSEWAANAAEVKPVPDPVVTASQLRAALSATGISTVKVDAAMEAANAASA